MVEEKFCRVCRCEGTPDHPLFHPCKCRGSIKYIHQDCLQYWLEHSNKDICDICHSKFNFKIIYNDGVPDSVPFRMILKQFFKDLVHYQYQIVKHFLMIFCAVFEVPTVISFIDKIIDFQLGVPIRIESPFLPNMFEDYKPSNSFIQNYLSFFQCVIFHGLFIGLTFSIIIISMIIIQNSFVGDEGFQKIIDKKIGPQRHKLVDLLQQNRRKTIMRALREQENVQRVNRELERVGWVEGHVYERAELLLMINSSGRMLDEMSDHPSLRDTYEPVRAFLNNINPDEISEEDTKKLVDIYKKLRITLLNHKNEEREMLQVIQDLANAEYNEDNIPIGLNERPLAGLNRNANIAEIPRHDPNIDQNDELDQPQGMWDGPKNITFIFQLTLLANLVSMAVLVCFKLIPSYQGMLFLVILDSLIVSPLKKIFMIAYPHVHPYISYAVQSKVSQYFREEYQKLIVPKLMVAFFERNLLVPLRDAYVNSVQWTPTSSSSERIIVIFTGFAVFGGIIYLCMKKMERSCTPNNPLTGTYRTVYIIMLQIASIVKVFTLIAIEWAIFPLFCGVQIEFALVPIFNENLYNYKLDPPFFGTDVFGLIPKWFMGTYFMYFFASFVSMIRSKILRNGVLFFIRPSDDPNLQLVHDALMRPFSLRLSRIALSAAVYSLYIHIEFSAVSWGIRLLSPIKVLPFHNTFFYERAMFALVFIIGSFLDDPFCRIWKFVFEFVCSQLRLSSFLLDKDDSKERGKIIYKTFFARLTNPKPNYSDPVLESETDLYFAAHPNALCCFVPDGNYVRAPNDDHVSRNFVRTLFVPVTKSDQLLAPIPEYPDDDEIYNPYGDVDPMDVTTYTIVYRPPNFKLRLFAFFAMLWLASMLLTLVLYLCNIAIGESFIKMIRFEKRLGIPTEIYKVNIYSVLFTLIVLSRLEIISKSLFEQWDALKAAWHADTGRFRAVSVIIANNLNKLKEQYRMIGNSAVVRVVLARLYQQFTITVGLGLCGFPVLGYLMKETYLPVWTWIYFGSFIPMIIAYCERNRDRTKVYFFTALFIVLVKLFLISMKANNAESVTQGSNGKITTDAYLIQRFMTNFLPSPLTSVSSLFVVDEFQGIESWSYFTLWIMASWYTSYVYISHGWKRFKDKTKQMYFDNMKVLSNADDNENDNYEDGQNIEATNEAMIAEREEAD